MSIRPTSIITLCLAFAATIAVAWMSPWANSVTASEAMTFTPLLPIPAPKIIAAAEAFSGSYAAENILKPATPHNQHSEYASRGMATKTFIDFDFGRKVCVAAFRHIQRRYPDTIAEANLVFSDTPDFHGVLATVKVKHIDESGATTFATFKPVTARYVRWQVTSLQPKRSPNVGGRGVEFFAAGQADASPQGIKIETSALPIIEQQSTGHVQTLKVNLISPYAESLSATVRVTGQEPRTVNLTFGSQTLPCTVTAVDSPQRFEIAVEVRGEKVVSQTATIPPKRILTVYILPHSHTDIGYTAIQTDIEEKQINNLLQGLADSRRTADYPEGARFVWNVEVAWAADLFLKRLPANHRKEFFDAVRRGQVAINGMYLNELTGLCRPEELVRLFRYATQLGERTGVPIDSAMISDVPGYTWGTVTAMNQAGIRYFSVAPNYFDRNRHDPGRVGE